MKRLSQWTMTLALAAGVVISSGTAVVAAKPSFSKSGGAKNYSSRNARSYNSSAAKKSYNVKSYARTKQSNSNSNARSSQSYKFGKSPTAKFPARNTKPLGTKAIDKKPIYRAPQTKKPLIKDINKLPIGKFQPKPGPTGNLNDLINRKDPSKGPTTFPRNPLGKPKFPNLNKIPTPNTGRTPFIPRKDINLGKGAKQMELIKKFRNPLAINDKARTDRLKDLAGKLGKSGISSRKFAPLPTKDLGSKFKDILKAGNGKFKNGAEHAKVKAFAQKHLGLHHHCGWWVDLCCHAHWWHHGCYWDCCYDPWYWDCWHPCHWHVVHCPRRVVVVNGVQQVFAAESYYLGLTGTMIPDTGFGIQEVKANSPAARAGLADSQVIVSVNGIALSSEEVLAQAIQQSGGVLQLQVLVQGSEQPVAVTVALDRIVSRSF